MTHQDRAIYARSLPLPHTQADWETLEGHAADVAQLARGFAEPFGAGDWGRLLGQWHDLGKASDDFQGYVSASGQPDAAEDEHAPGRVDHSTFCARHPVRSVAGLAGQLLAFCIAGHHGGLADAAAAEEERRRSTLSYQLDERTYAIEPVALPADVPRPPQLTFPFASRLSPGEAGFAAARMLFSTLVDAGRTATEAFCDPARRLSRTGPLLGGRRGPA